MTRKHKIVLLSCAVAAAIGVAILGPILLALYVDIPFLAPKRKLDPLMRIEVEAELDNLPTPETVFYDRVRGQQTYFDDYGTGMNPGITVEDYGRWELRQAEQDGRLRMVSGKTIDDAVRLRWVISWDGPGNGTHALVNHTGQWTLLVDENDIIIGYFDKFTG
jgi:hypothetical protein